MEHAHPSYAHIIFQLSHTSRSIQIKIYAQILHQYVIFSSMEEPIFGLVMILI